MSTCLVLPSCEGEDPSLRERVGLPWGWPRFEVYLHLGLAAAARGEEMAVCAAHPICPCLLTQCPLTISSGGGLKDTLGIRKRVKSLLCACIRPDLPFG